MADSGLVDVTKDGCRFTVTGDVLDPKDAQPSKSSGKSLMLLYETATPLIEGVKYRVTLQITVPNPGYKPEKSK